MVIDDQHRFLHGLILAYGPSQIHTAGRTARAVTRNPAGSQPNRLDACQPPGLEDPPLAAWRHVRNPYQGGSTMSINSIASGAAPTIKRDSARADSLVRAPEVRGEDRPGLGRSSDRYEAVRQYSLGKILAVWAAAAIPMGILA